MLLGALSVALCAAQPQIAVPVPVVVEVGLPVMVLPRQPDGLVHVVRVVFLFEVAPRVQFCRPSNVAFPVGERQRRAQVVAVVVVDLDRGFALRPLF